MGHFSREPPSESSSFRKPDWGTRREGSHAGPYHMPPYAPTAPSGDVYREGKSKASNSMMMGAAAGAGCYVLALIVLYGILRVAGEDSPPRDSHRAMRREALECRVQRDVVELR